MPTPVVLELNGVRLTGELYDSEAGRAIAELLPLTMSLSRWGEEFYGSVGAQVGPFGGKQRSKMAVGELGYWEPGNAFCLFWGPTPASHGDEPRAASEASPLGKVDGDWNAVSALGGSARATLSRA